MVGAEVIREKYTSTETFCSQQRPLAERGCEGSRVAVMKLSHDGSSAHAWIPHIREIPSVDNGHERH